MRRVRRTRDVDAFGLLVDRHQRQVRSVCARLLHGDRLRADAVANDVYLLAWTKLLHGEPIRSFRAWILRVATLKCMEHNRNRRAQRRDHRRTFFLSTAEGEVELPDPSAVQPGTDRFDELVAGLPQESQEILAMRFVDEMNLDEIAESLGISTPTVHRRIQEALAVLRRRLRRLLSD